MRKTSIKEIIKESVIDFLNETDFKKLPVKGKFKTSPVPMDIKKGIPVSFKKPSSFDPKLKSWKKLPLDVKGKFGSKPTKIPIKKVPSTDFDLSEEQKEEIKEVVKKVLQREGLMSFTYGNDVDSGKSYVGARIDPTNKKDWILTKEELIYELPIGYGNKLHSYVKDLRKKLTENRD